VPPHNPNKLGPGERRGASRGAADQASHAGAPVHIHLTAMIIFSGRPGHGLGGVLGTYRVDSVVRHTLRHELDEIGPNPQPAPPTQPVAWAMRIDPVTKQHLGPVHVADT